MGRKPILPLPLVQNILKRADRQGDKPEPDEVRVPDGRADVGDPRDGWRAQAQHQREDADEEWKLLPVFPELEYLHHKRKRLADPDGISIKATIDGIVLAGILQDDNAKIINQVSQSQEKCKLEETIIDIVWEDI